MNNDAADTLNDLILMNNDRMKGYQRAIKDIGPRDADLKGIFKELADQSALFNAALIREVEGGGFRAETESSVSGRLHRVWMDIKSALSGSSRKTILEECEKGEDASKETYRDALHEDNGLSNEQRELIAAQAAIQAESHTRIRQLRDEARI